jgi:hypothetical protein
MTLPKKIEAKVRNRSEFSYKTDAQTPLATVFAYLNGKFSKTFTQREGKQRAIDALLAFWRPYALRANKSASEEVREAAIASVEALFRQLQRICADFAVDSPCSPNELVDFNDLLTALTARVEQPIPSPDPLSQPQARSHPPPITNAATTSEVIFVDDEELLGDLL